MLSPGEYEAAQESRELAELADHPGWPHLIKTLEDYDKQLLQEMAVLDDPKALVRAADIWRIFNLVKKIVESSPAQAKFTYEGIKLEENQDDVDVKVGTFFNTLPYASDKLPMV